MCTVTWSSRRDGYDLFFNRDELHTRAAERPPESSRAAGVAFIAPRDGDHGGTWLLVNEFGLTFCLLNDYGRPPATGEPRFSRGHLVLACAAATSLAEAELIVHRQPLSRMMAFHLVGLAPDTEPLVLHWDGATLACMPHAGARPLFTSSSFATHEVIAARRYLFKRRVRSPLEPESGELDSFHRERVRAAGAHSVLMCRPDAATRSIIHVRVRRESVDLRYEPVSWTQEEPTVLAPATTSLSRRQSARAALCSHRAGFPAGCA